MIVASSFSSFFLKNRRISDFLEHLIEYICFSRNLLSLKNQEIPITCFSKFSFNKLLKHNDDNEEIMINDRSNILYVSNWLYERHFFALTATFCNSFHHRILYFMKSGFNVSCIHAKAPMRLYYCNFFTNIDKIWMHRERTNRNASCAKAKTHFDKGV